MKKHVMFFVILAVLALGLTPALASNTLETDQRTGSTSAAITEFINDGSFELCSTISGDCPDWDTLSLTFGSPICDIATCGDGGGTAGPRTGNIWGWFGGIGNNEEAWLTQDVVDMLPECGLAELSFYLWDGTGVAGTDIFEVILNSDTLFSVTEGDPTYMGGYTLVTLDVSAYLGTLVEVTFHGTDLVGPTTNFNLDDVSLTVDDSVGCEEPAPEVPAVNFPNKGEILISAGAPVMTYGAAGNYPTGIVLPADYDGNGFDTYTVTGTTTVAGETWYSVWVGGAQYLWVPASQVTTLR